MAHSQSMRLNPRAHMPLNYSHSLSSTNDNDPVSQIFDQFCIADTFRDIMDLFEQLCHAAGICPKDHVIFYQQLKKKLMSWRAQSLWFKLDKRASSSEYKSGTACNKTRVLVIGAGPCGLRVAIEMALLGAKTVVVEKRDSFSRNNVLHLWPFLIHDLKALGAKKFFGKFCAGAIDHISIRTLQCILLKVALLVGVEIHSGVSFEGFLEPQNDAGGEDTGWRARVIPGSHPVSEFIFDVCFSADGQRNTMTEFKRKELRGKFAIGITANFVNRKTQAEASVEEISGVSFIFNQKFFRDLHEETGIDLENIVYYKDETHYFVMTAKKQSLLKKGVLKQDHDDPEMLLSKENLNHDSLLSYAREAASYSTNHQLPSLDFAPNYSGQPDVDMFDFTSMFAAENASRVIERRKHLLLIGLVGDTLLEPFWPTGSGCARGFLGALDGAWMVRSWASGEMSTLEVIAERESIYQLLSQTKPDNLSKNYANYTIDPNTRYTNLQMHTYKPYEAKSLYDGKGNPSDVVHLSKRRNLLYGCSTRNWNLLRWFQKELESYDDLVAVVDFSKSWQSGLALCALIHRHWPHLVDVYSLDPKDVEYNNQLAFDILKEHCKLLPPATGQYMTLANIPEEKMINFLSQIQDHFKQKSLENRKAKAGFYDKKSSRSTGSLAEALIDPGSNAENIDKIEMIENNPSSLKPSQLNPESVMRTLKRIRDSEAGQNTVSAKTVKSSELEDILNGSRHHNNTGIGSLFWKPTKVSVLARDLVLKFKGEYVDDCDKKQNAKPISPERRHLRDVCCSCRERVFVTERCIAEGQLFHRQCFRCEYCCGLLDVSSYSAQKNDKGTDVFFHPRCHDIQMRKKENPIKQQFNSHSSWLIAPVDRATFESTRRILLRQSQMKKNDRSKSQLQSNVAHQQTVVGARGYDDDFKSSTEQELCFSDESDSEKPDLSWDQYMRSAEEKSGLSRVMKGSFVNRQQITMEQMDDSRGSDADWETDTSDVDTDIPSSSDASHDEGGRIARPSEAVESRTLAAATDEIQENKNLKQGQESRLKNRMAFFGAVAEPVRINARQFLGLDPQIASDAASTAATNDTKNSEKEDAETEEKSSIQDDNMEERGELIREDRKAESDISKRQLKRKTKPKTKKKKLRRARKQANEEKTNSRLSETAIASSVLAAKRQTVAVVPVSEESSGVSDSSNEEEDSLEIKGYSRLKAVHRHLSSAEDGNDRDDVDLVSSASVDVQTSGLMEETAVSAEMRDNESEEAMPFHVLDEQDFSSETDAPRPGLLVAEAMFRSYEESTVVTTTSGSDKCFDSSSDNDDKAKLLAPDKGDEDHQYGEDIDEQMVAPCQRSSFSNTEVEGRDSKIGTFQHRSGSIDLQHEESSLNESAFVDLKSSPEVINDGCVTDLTEVQNDSVSTRSADTGSQIHENVRAGEIRAAIGLELPYMECGVDRNLDTDYHCEFSVDHSDEKQQSVLLKLGNEDGGQIRKINPPGDCLETRCPPRAESESYSEDESEMSSSFLSQNALPDKSDGIQQHLNRERLEKDKDSLLQSGLSIGKNLEFIDDKIDTNCVDPVQRLDDLLCRLSSRNSCVSDLVATPALLNTYCDAENVNSGKVLCVQPMEQHQKKFHGEGKIKCENVRDSVTDKHVINEESAVDENVNYIHPTLVSLQENEADEERKLESSSSNSSKCLCMDVSEVGNYQTSGAEVSGYSPTTATGYNEDIVEKKQEPRSMSKDIGCTAAVSPVSLLDAKRRFFQQVAQPVRINPLTVFKSDVPSKLPEEKPCHASLLQSCSSSKPRTPEEEKQLEIDDVTIKEEEKFNRHSPLTGPSPLDLSAKNKSHLQTDVELGQLSNELGTLSLSESEISCKASLVAKRCLPSSVLLSSSNVLTESDQTRTPLAAKKCTSLPNVQLLTTVSESERFMSHLLAENLRLDHKNLMKTWDRMKAGSSSLSEFRNSEIETEIDEMHSTTSSEIPNCLNELVELERQSTA